MTALLVSIPSKRGNGSDRLIRFAVTEHSLGSQSPQSGAMVRTACTASTQVYCTGLNPLKAGQWFGPKTRRRIEDRIRSQSPQSGAMVRTHYSPSVGEGRTRLNPLKAGQWFGQICTKCSKIFWEPSQSPQSGAMVRTAAEWLQEMFPSLVSIPSKRGNGSDLFETRDKAAIASVSIPSKRGNGSDRSLCVIYRLGYKSQSPQSGAMVRTFSRQETRQL